MDADNFEKSRIMAQEISKEDMERIEALRKETKKLSNELVKKYPKVLERMSLAVFWEYDNRHWSDCPHADELQHVICDRMMEEEIDDRRKKHKKQKGGKNG